MTRYLDQTSTFVYEEDGNHVFGYFHHHGTAFCVDQNSHVESLTRPRICQERFKVHEYFVVAYEEIIYYV
jgi:TRAP-type mannitol/chloroaromatic compound transport system permease small subunit